MNSNGLLKAAHHFWTDILVLVMSLNLYAVISTVNLHPPLPPQARRLQLLSHQVCVRANHVSGAMVAFGLSTKCLALTQLDYQLYF